MATRRGTAGNDTLTGTSAADSLLGLAGNDRLSGGGGNDSLDGAAGADQLRGEAGDDRLRGGNDDDLLDGGAGADQLRGDAGNDRLIFDRADTRIDGGTGTDTLQVDGAGTTLNSAALAAARALEIIDLRGSGANRIVIDAALATRLSDDDILRIRAGSDDEVIAHGGWQAGANTVIDGVTYKQLTLAGATLQIELAAHTLINGVLPLAGMNSGDGYRLDGGAAFDLTGIRVSGIGDFNGDRLDDFLIGSFGVDTVLGDNVGASYVVFGRVGTPAASVSLNSLDGTNGFRIEGEVAGGRLGAGVHGLGDVNGDGRADLIVGAPFASPDAVTFAGSSYVLYGQSSSAAVMTVATLVAGQGYRIDGGLNVERTGAAVSNAGDFNGDGLDDVLIGGYGADNGSAYVVFGTRDSIAAPLTLNTLDGLHGFRMNGVNGTGLTGKAVAGGGDVNGDRIDDIVIGAPDGTGRSYVVFGHGGTFGSIQNLADLDGHTGLRIDGVGLNADSGVAVSIVGDINGDGIDDVLIGADDVSNNAEFAGASYVIFGQRGDFAAVLSVDALNGSNGFRLDGVAASDFSGRAVSGAGDINGDGYDDVLIGATNADPPGATGAGASYVLFGHGGSFAATLSLADINGSNGLRVDGALTGDGSGGAVASAGDVDGDGYADLLIGAVSSDVTGYSAGSTYVLYGRDFTGAVTRQGGAGNDAFTGTTAAENFLGGRGNDTLNGGSGADVLRGGAGNDVLVWNRDARVLDGGNGSDTLRVDGGGVNLSLALPAISSIETIDLRAAGANTLALDALDVLRLTDAPHLMTVRGDANDLVNLGGQWQNDGEVVTGFTRYTQGEASIDIASPVRVLTLNRLSLATLDGNTGVEFHNLERANPVVNGAGDINGDGLSDLLLGSGDLSPGGLNHAGNVQVVYGRSGAFTSPLDLAALDASAGLRIDGAVGNAKLGLAVSAAGDVNGDGIDDFVLGAPTANIDDGSAYLLFGHAGGVPAPVALDALDGSNGQLLVSGATITRAGSALGAAGDINGDGYDDLIIGTGAGAGALVVFGHGDGFAATLALTALDGQRGFRVIHGGADIGASVAGAGDVNGDGFADIIIGAPGAVPNGVSYAGSSFVLFGHGGGFAATLDLDTFNASQGFRVDGLNVNDFVGTQVAGAGDMNGDGFADLLISAEGADPDGRNAAGSTYIVFGHGGAFDANINLNTLDGRNGFRIDGGNAGDRSGLAASAAGDVNGDGYDDVLLGASESSVVGNSAGIAYVVFGHGGVFDQTLNLGTAGAGSVLQLTTAINFDRVGGSVSAAGDVNGDGFADVFLNSGPLTGGYLVFGRDFNGVLTREGTSGNDTLLGTLAADALVGGLGNDLIDGLGGADALAGGAGDDTFIWHDGVRRIDGGGGSDRLRITGTQSLFELQATSAATLQGVDIIDLNGIGNNGLRVSLHGVSAVSDANVVRVEGNAGDFVIAAQDSWNAAGGAPQTLNGQQYARYTSGPATLLIDTDITVFRGTEIAAANTSTAPVIGGTVRKGTAGKDVLNGTSGNNTLQGLAGDDKLNGMAGNDRLEGGAGRDSLTGGAGHDRLDGGAGRDVLRGDAGNDTYVIDDATEIVKGTRDDGIDTVLSSVSYTLGAQQEHLTLTGKLSINATGNGLANTLIGNSGQNTLDGGAGRDTLLAGAGNDKLVFDRADVRQSGGTGEDTLVINGAGVALGRASLAQVDQVEVIDLRGSGANRLAVDALFADSLSDTTTLRVRGDTNDSVFIAGGWSANGTTVIDTITYNAYQQGAVNLLVESAAQQLVNGDLALAALDGVNGYRLDGVSPNDATGRGVNGVGDVNGDGLADFMLGAFLASPGGHIEAGSGKLVFGRTTSLGATLDTGDVASDVVMHFNSTVDGERIGFAVSAAGDIDGDGLGDFLVGAFSSPQNNYVGSAYVVLGKALAGFGANVALDSLDGSTGFKVSGINGFDGLGFSVAGGGDINGDGLDDFMISAYGYDQPGGYAGATYVIFGRTDAFAATLDVNSLDGTDGFRIEGAGAGDRSGHAVASGDFNGDGFADVIVGANFASGSEHYSGSAFVVFGHDGSFTPTLSLSAPEVLRIDGAVSGDYAGFALASAGDINGDGYDDIIIGATGVDAGEGTAAGAAYVVFGHAEPFTTMNLGALDGATGFRINGAAADQQLGAVVSGGGDVNGDGYADLIIGASLADVGDHTDAGASYVLFGHAGSFAANIATSDLNGSNGLRLAGVTTNDQSGIAVSIAGDVDGDGYDDMLVGASAADNGAGPNNGSAYVIDGRDFTGGVAWQGSGGADVLKGDASDEILIGGLGADSLDGGAGHDVLRGGAGNDVLVWDREDRLVDGGGGADTLRIARGGADLTEGGPALRGIERIDLGVAGSNSLTLNATAVRALGDQPRLTVDGDSADFVNLHGLWSNQGEQLPGYVRFASHGAVVDVANSIAVVNDGLIALTNLDARLGLALGGVAAGDNTGVSVAGAGDVNGDGFADFIIGASGADNHARDHSGASYVVFGSANGLAPGMTLATLNGSNGFRIDGASADDSSGQRVSGAGDVNGDGFDDVLLGHLGDGAQQLLFGHGGSFAASLDLATLPAVSGVVMNANGVSSLARAGDFNGDGFDDFVFGARFADPPGNYSGASYLVHGSKQGLPATLDLTALEPPQGLRINGIAQSQSGHSVAGGGDFNGDGYDDILIGAPQIPVGNDHPGASFLLFGQGAAPAAPLDLANLNASQGVRINGVNASDRSGKLVSFIGDINGDGLDDVLISSSDASPHGADSGSNYVVFGTTAPFSGAFSLADLNGHNGFRLDGSAVNDAANGVAGVGDVNGDGYDDLFIGTPYAGNGRGYLLFGHGGDFEAVSEPGFLDGQRGLRFEGALDFTYAGFSASAAGDIDGDGYADILIGAPVGNGGAGYVIHGRDFTGSVTQQGGTGNDSITGSSADEVFVGGQGRDVLDGAGGADVLIGGAGDDVLIWHSGLHSLDGGSGSDTLRAVGSDVILDFTQANAARARGIDVIDLTGSGNNLLEITLSDVLHMSDHNSLRIDGNAGDVVMSGGHGWKLTAGAPVTVGGQQYLHYDVGGAQLLVDTDITQWVS
ncbi:MAG: FG-GAP repeat protein [Gammaproteobacteria bacterium]|nr:FG-GAP repeat protein [Gammaproteobacteria bacterium]